MPNTIGPLPSFELTIDDARPSSIKHYVSKVFEPRRHMTDSYASDGSRGLSAPQKVIMTARLDVRLQLLVFPLEALYKSHASRRELRPTMAAGNAPAEPARIEQIATRNPIQSKRQRYMAFALVTSLFFTWGFCYGLQPVLGLLDVLNKHFVNIFGITKLQSTMMQTAYFGAYFVFAIPAGQFASRFGYKASIHVGLTLYMIGAFCFWPSATTSKYYGFVLSTIVIGTGLVCGKLLYIGAGSISSTRLLPVVPGGRSLYSPLIASHTFFKSENDDSLTSVQYVYLGVGLLGLVLNILFFFCKLPEISEEQLQEGLTIFGFVAQFAYCGAQVGVISFVMFYIADDPYLHARLKDSDASNMVSYFQITFMLVALTTGGRAGLASMFIILFFESIQFPVIFVMGTANLGKWTKRGSSIIIMGVGGGAVFPPAQGAISDNISTRRSYGMPFLGFAIVWLYALGTLLTRKHKTRTTADVLTEQGIDETTDSSRDKGSDEKVHEKHLGE
ncbi:MFS general substrate transporter [Auriculariales sp. MPI-PUGE-AT-0066]|nr:MFS general substrate transporter [Auriculariales sp. MPI-PUGE-AT-0066]